jgi:hypothetical protein
MKEPWSRVMLPRNTVSDVPSSEPEHINLDPEGEPNADGAAPSTDTGISTSSRDRSRAELEFSLNKYEIKFGAVTTCRPSHTPKQARKVLIWV